MLEQQIERVKVVEAASEMHRRPPIIVGKIDVASVRVDQHIQHLNVVAARRDVQRSHAIQFCLRWLGPSVNETFSDLEILSVSGPQQWRPALGIFCFSDSAIKVRQLFGKLSHKRLVAVFARHLKHRKPTLRILSGNILRKSHAFQGGYELFVILSLVQLKYLATLAADRLDRAEEAVLSSLHHGT